MLPLPSAATISDLIQTRPDQGYCYLNRLLQLKEITSDTITMEGYIDLFKSMLSWVLRAPMSVIQLAEWQDLLKEITRYLEMFFHSYGTYEVVPVIENKYFDVSIVGWDTCERIIKLLDNSILSDVEYSATFYMNLLKLMTVNNPQAHSVVPGIL